MENQKRNPHRRNECVPRERGEFAARGLGFMDGHFWFTRIRLLRAVVAIKAAMKQINGEGRDINYSSDDLLS